MLLKIRRVTKDHYCTSNTVDKKPVKFYRTELSTLSTNCGQEGGCICNGDTRGLSPQEKMSLALDSWSGSYRCQTVYTCTCIQMHTQTTTHTDTCTYTYTRKHAVVPSTITPELTLHTCKLSDPNFGPELHTALTRINKERKKFPTRVGNYFREIQEKTPRIQGRA